MELEKHYTNRSGWLRAAVLGANDGIISTSSLVIGIAAASDTRNPIILAALAGVVAGALSMAAGEYVSVSSQADIETADLKREMLELETIPEIELLELAKIYEKRGLSKELSIEVAKQLTAHDALGAHARDELGINEITNAKPLQAAFASASAFIVGGLLPLTVAISAPIKSMIPYQYGCAILFLAISAMASAKAGGATLWKSVIRICFWGTVAMAVSALVGYFFNVGVN
ncbi:VIT1/CCC1 transporter family protein [Pedobacter boryungensis]|uniref:VIT family protein n=1 Tax=Pedobacter boryungensis TaxID=869962 RepID=A0ABX2DC83_9SPHI|nr:VIT family protein [Pedobacter boryungensis]NQX31615.1 VIT family protein [Pedobacter boryungensis]